MAHKLILRDRRTKAPKTTPGPRQISIYHPGYDKDIPLISFQGYDSEEGDLWHNFAHTACAIISNNQYNGWLSAMGIGCIESDSRWIEPQKSPAPRVGNPLTIPIRYFDATGDPRSEKLKEAHGDRQKGRDQLFQDPTAKSAF